MKTFMWQDITTCLNRKKTSYHFWLLLLPLPHYLFQKLSSLYVAATFQSVIKENLIVYFSKLYFYFLPWPLSLAQPTILAIQFFALNEKSNLFYRLFFSDWYYQKQRSSRVDTHAARLTFIYLRAFRKRRFLKVLSTLNVVSFPVFSLFF